MLGPLTWLKISSGNFTSKNNVWKKCHLRNCNTCNWVKWLSLTFFSYVEDANMFKVAGGAYIFHPLGEATPIVKNPTKFEYYDGKYVKEMRQEFTGPCSNPKLEICGITQVIRLYVSGENYLPLHFLLVEIWKFWLQLNLMYTDSNSFC